MSNKLDNTIIIVLGFHLIGNRRGVSKEQVKIMSNLEEVPQDLLTTSKKLLDSKELRAINTADTRLKGWIKDNIAIEVPFVRNSSHVIPVSLLEQTDERIRNHIEVVRPQLVTNFVDLYLDQIEEARVKLGPLFDRTQYKSLDAARRSFWVDYDFDTFAPPSALQDFNRDIYRRACEKAEARINGAMDDVVQALRAQFLGLTSQLAESLSGKGKNGKPQRFYQSSIDHMTEFLETFKARNLFEDDELERITNEARALIAGVDADVVRSNVEFREELGRRFTAVTEQLDGLVVTKTRKFDFSQEDENDPKADAA